MNGKIMFIWNPHVIEHITNAKISLLGSGVMGVPSGIVETFLFRAMAVAEKVACPAARKPAAAGCMARYILRARRGRSCMHN